MFLVTPLWNGLEPATDRCGCLGDEVSLAHWVGWGCDSHTCWRGGGCFGVVGDLGAVVDGFG